MAIEMVSVQEQGFQAGTCIKVIGIGGGGGNAVAHMLTTGISGAEFIFANTDAQDLSKYDGQTQVQLGNTGQGAGCDPLVGREMTQEAEEEIRTLLSGAHMLFITAGMGGGTGTGGAPVVARIAREMGILTVAVVTKPFDFEGSRKTTQAEEGVSELEQSVNALIVVMNDKLLEIDPDIDEDEAFELANDVLKNAVRGISEIITVKGNMNVDFADVKAVMSEPGKALMGVAAAEGENRAAAAAQQAIACPLLEGVDLRDAKGLLVVIASAGKRKLREVNEVMSTLQQFTASDAVIKFGTVNDETLGDKLSVTVVATGLNSTASQGENGRKEVPWTIIRGRTGTDDATAVAQPVRQQAGAAGGSLPVSRQADSVQSRMQPQPGTPAGGAGSHSGVAVGGVASDKPAPSKTTPSVWSTPRSGISGFSGGAASADTRVDAMQSSGMTDAEIPAFLRKQAD